MTMRSAKHFSTRQTAQNQPIPGRESEMVKNAAGGYVFPVDDWIQLDRWLLMGSEGGTYHVGEQALTISNCQALVRCLAEDGQRAVQRIVEISLSGRAPKNDQAIFSLAVAAGFRAAEDRQGSPASPELAEARKTRQLALACVSKVCRIGTHLFQFNEWLKQFRQHGRGWRRAMQDWYMGQPPGALAYNVAKYQQRSGWSHRDILRLAKPVGNESPAHNEILHWVVKGWPGVGEQPHPNKDLQILWAFERAKATKSRKEIVALIRDYRLPRECVPTEWLNEPEVWDALLAHMPIGAMLRNLGKMTAVGLLAPLSIGVRTVVRKLADQNALERQRVHPIACLLASRQYAAGRGLKGKLTWGPIPQIVDAVEDAFYATFGNVPVTGLNWLLALDVSGSMHQSKLASCPHMSAAEAAAAMSLVTANVEKQHSIVGFTADKGAAQSYGAWQSHQPSISPLNISPRQRIGDVCAYTRNLPFGGTDCALPMLYAMENNIPVDVFVIYTDNETWAGKIHVSQALDQYRQKTGRPAKAIAVAFAATSYSVFDQKDAGCLTVVGFDAAAPGIMSDFAAGQTTRPLDDNDQDDGVE